MRKTGRTARWLLVGLCLAIGLDTAMAGPAGAHRNDESYLYLDVTDTTLGGSVQMPYPDIRAVIGLRLEGSAAEVRSEIEANLPTLQAYAAEQTSVGSGGIDWEMTFEGYDVLDDEPVGSDGLGYVILPFMIGLPEQEVPQTIAVTFTVFLDEIPDRNNIALIANDWKRGVIDQETNELVVFTPDMRNGSIDLADPSQWKNFRASIDLGVDHIKTGPDHILFVLVLLLPSVLIYRSGWKPAHGFGQSLWRVLKVITTFTVAHTITFSLAGLDLLPLPNARFIETVIALSITAAALHNLRPIVRNKEWIIAFVFGLFHGMGFASLVNTLEVSRATQLVSLLGRNVGIEVGQTVVVLLTFPSLFLLRRTRFYRPFFVAGSLGLVVISLGWVTERLFDAPDLASTLMAGIFAFPRIYFVVAAATAVSAGLFLIERRAGRLLPIDEAGRRQLIRWSRSPSRSSSTTEPGDRQQRMRIAYITDGLSSSVNAGLELGRRLTAAGHEVVYLSPADIASVVERAGHRFVPLTADRDFIEAAAGPVGWSGIVKLRQWSSALWRRRAVRQASIDNREIDLCVASVDPDVLLIDFEMHFAVFATAPRGIPTLLTTVFFSVFRAPGLLPLDSTSSPASVDEAGRRSLWRRHWLETRWSETRQRLIRTLKGDWFRPARYNSMDIDTLRSVARSRGVPTADLGRSDWQRPFTHRSLPMLSFNLFDLELPHDPRPGLHFVGPMVRTDHLDKPTDSPAWEAFRSQRHNARPLVYCSLGSYWATDLGLLRRIVDVFRRRHDWDLVVGLGGRSTVEELGPTPPNVLVLHDAPQVQILGQSNCCITHGGAATLAECVTLAVPTVVYSTGHVDQNGNAVRVGFHQVGDVGDPAHDDGQRIESRVVQVLADPSYRQRLRQLEIPLRHTHSRAVELIEAAAGGADLTRPRPLEHDEPDA